MDLERQHRVSRSPTREVRKRLHLTHVIPNENRRFAPEDGVRRLSVMLGNVAATKR